MNIFVSGSESFIGQQLCWSLADTEHKVVGLDLRTPTPRPWKTLEGDIRNPNLAHFVPEDAVIIHLAAVSTDAACKADPLHALDVNVGGTLNVLKAANERQCRQFIFASTEWVYGEREAGTACHEHCWTPAAGVYARSKLVGEQLLALSGLPSVTVLRFGITYGQRLANWCAVEALAAKVLAGEDVTVGSLQTARRFVHVRDLCAGILASIGRTGQETFNLAGQRLITLGEVLKKLEPFAGKPLRVQETDPSNPSIRNPTSSKAFAAFGWRAQIAFGEGIREVVEYLKGRKA